MAPKTVFHRVPVAQIIPAAISKSYTAVAQTLLTLKALAMQDVSPKDLGGPVMIFQVTRDAAQMGWGRLLDITALISINLFVFNLLPLPVLDGGPDPYQRNRGDPPQARQHGGAGTLPDGRPGADHQSHVVCDVE